MLSIICWSPFIIVLSFLNELYQVTVLLSCSSIILWNVHMKLFIEVNFWANMKLTFLYMDGYFFTLLHLDNRFLMGCLQFGLIRAFYVNVGTAMVDINRFGMFKISRFDFASAARCASGK